MDMRELMARAQEMQAKAAELKQAMEAVEIEGQSGGGLVRAVLNGKGELVRLSVDPSLVKSEEREILEDLIVAAHGDAKRTLDARLAEEMGKLAGSFGVPGLG